MTAGCDHRRTVRGQSHHRTAAKTSEHMAGTPCGQLPHAAMGFCGAQPQPQSNAAGSVPAVAVSHMTGRCRGFDGDESTALAMLHCWSPVHVPALAGAAADTGAPDGPPLSPPRPRLSGAAAVTSLCCCTASRRRR